MPSLEATLRHETIIDALNRNGTVKVTDLAETLGVSSVTVRADLEYLEEQRVLRRTRGGALPVRPRRYEEPFEIARADRSEQKAAIGRQAASMVRDGDTVIIDVGTTTWAMTGALPQSLRDVVVVTNSLNIALAMESHPGLTVVVTGGTLRSLQHSLVNPLGTHLLREINADVAFLGCNGVDPEKGFTNTNMVEAEIKRAMIQSASRVVFLADSAKLMRVATARVAEIDQVDTLITDRGATPEALSSLGATGLEVVVAP